ncbi:MAG: hypothetical protein C0483_10100 [Pirellula sp.]|nr:hypothetical protein [Pirellula sp.]
MSLDVEDFLMLGLCKKLLDCGQVLGLEGGPASLMSWKPRSLASFKVLTSLKREPIKFNTILDGGANVGQFARAARWAYPDATIHCFEPQADIADKLTDNLRDLKNIEVHRTALGANDGSIEFHRAEQSQESSILRRARNESNGDGATRAVNVPITRLDTWASTRTLVAPILLKLDLQGYELTALQGAEELLSRTSYVLSEAIFENEYEGEPPFDELWRFLSARNFRFLRPVAALQDLSKGVVQFDALFKRNE